MSRSPYGFKRRSAGSWRTVFAVPYLVVFAVAGIVGLQLLRSSSAAPLSGGAIQITVGQPSYTAGQTIRFTIRNDSESTISVPNNCPDAPLEVYRLEQSGWQRQHAYANDDKCINAPRSYSVASGSSVSATYIYWPELFAQPGRYRLVVPLLQNLTKPEVEFDVVAP